MNCNDFQDKIKGAQRAVEYFTCEKRKTIYSVLLEMDCTEYGYDPIVMVQRTKDKGVLACDVTEIYSIMSTGVNINFHFNLLEEAYLKRRMFQMMEYSKERLYQPETQAIGLLEEMGRVVNSIQEKAMDGKAVYIGETLPAAMDYIYDKLDADSGITGYSTGLFCLDQVIRGVEKGKMYVIAARPSKGKTALCLDLGEGVAAAGVPTLVAEMEMLSHELTGRVLQKKARIDFYGDQNAKEDGQIRLRHEIKDIGDLALKINDSGARTIDSIEMEARKTKREFKRKFNTEDGCLIVDYIGLMSTPSNISRREGLSDASRRFKALAKELDWPVIILSQLNRNIENDTKVRKPRKSDLKETGSLEEDADCVILIHDEEQENKDNEFYQLVIDKNRGGLCTDIPVCFIKKYQMFVARDDRYLID